MSTAGGGLIFIAGDSNAKLAEEPKTPFEKMLPVRAEPPPEKPTAVVLVLDKSGSMSGPKIEMARDAARASIRTLRPIDMIGVISFDETFNWVIPLGPAGSLEDKSNLISQITANGGTKIYQAVESGFEAIVNEKATHKHIILLTDGVSTPGTQEDFPKLERDALAKHVTISTIGVGDYINRDLLDELARKTKGKSHFVDNPENDSTDHQRGSEIHRGSGHSGTARARRARAPGGIHRRHRFYEGATPARVRASRGQRRFGSDPARR